MKGKLIETRRRPRLEETQIEVSVPVKGKLIETIHIVYSLTQFGDCFRPREGEVNWNPVPVEALLAESLR